MTAQDDALRLIRERGKDWEASDQGLDGIWALVEMWEALKGLDGHLSRGGTLPEAWERKGPECPVHGPIICSENHSS